MPLWSSSRPGIKARVLPRLPATLQATGGLAVSKENGIWTFEPDWNELALLTPASVTDPSAYQVWVLNEDTDEYSRMSLAGLAESQFLATSITSLAVGSGSKEFTIQTGKNITVGDYVLATSDADTSNFMFGRVTAYSGAALTVSVTAGQFGGSGTYADWTIRPAGIAGVNQASGIRQAYSSTTADADPGAGTFRLNNATPASATAAYLDNADTGGVTVSGVFDLWDDSTNTVKGSVRFEKTIDPTVWAAFQVTGSVVDGTGYRKLTLANGVGSGSFTSGDGFSITFFRAGDVGSVAGSTGASDNRLIRADGTGGSTIQSSAITVDDSGNMSGVGTLNAGATTTTTISATTITTSGDIELGNASDTTVSRAAGGVIAVEGVRLTPNIPITSKSTAYTVVLGDANTAIYHPSSDNNPRTFTIDSNANVAYPVGTCLTFINEVNTVTIAITSDTLTQAGTGSTGSRTLAANGMATAIKVDTTKWVISGAGLT